MLETHFLFHNIFFLKHLDPQSKEPKTISTEIPVCVFPKISLCSYPRDAYFDKYLLSNKYNFQREDFLHDKHHIYFLKVEAEETLSMGQQEEILIIFTFLIFDIFEIIIPVQPLSEFVFKDYVILEPKFYSLYKEYSYIAPPHIDMSAYSEYPLGIVDEGQFNKIRKGFIDAFQLKSDNTELFYRICTSINLINSAVNSLSEKHRNPITIVLLRQVFEIIVPSVLRSGIESELNFLCKKSRQIHLNPFSLNESLKRLSDVRNDIIHGSYYQKTGMNFRIDEEIKNAQKCILKFVRLLIECGENFGKN